MDTLPEQLKPRTWEVYELENQQNKNIVWTSLNVQPTSIPK